MLIRNGLITAAILFSGGLLINSVFAKQLTIVDQSGNALANAVIEFDADTPLPVEKTPAIMDQINKQFVPNVLVIREGRLVSFPNSDNIRHNVYSFSKPKTFDIRLYSGNTAEPVLFDKAGVVVLGCNIHDQMIGYIYVAEDRQTVLTGENGTADIPDNVQEVSLWHPDLSFIQSERMTVTLDEAKASEQLTMTLTAKPMTEKDDAPATFGKRKFGSQ